MSEEIRNEEIKTEEKVCRCEQDLFKKFALITAGAFTGCLLALCVFTTFTKPPVMPCPCAIGGPVQMQRPMYHHEYGRPDFGPHHRMDRRDHRRGDFHKKHLRQDKQLPRPDQDKLSK